MFLAPFGYKLLPCLFGTGLQNKQINKQTNGKKKKNNNFRFWKAMDFVAKDPKPEILSLLIHYHPQWQQSGATGWVAPNLHIQRTPTKRVTIPLLKHWLFCPLLYSECENEATPCASNVHHFRIGHRGDERGEGYFSRGGTRSSPVFRRAWRTVTQLHEEPRERKVSPKGLKQEGAWT